MTNLFAALAAMTIGASPAPPRLIPVADLHGRVASLMRQGQCNDALAAAFRAGDMALVSRVRMGCR